MSHFFVLFLLGFLLSACEEEKQINQILVGTSADYSPFEFYQDGEIVGFEMDLLREIAKQLEKEYVIKDMPFESLVGSLQTKRIDLSISALTPTPERSEKVDFSIPYYKSSTVMIISKDSAIKKVDDLAGKTVGVQSGTVYEATVKNEWMQKVQYLKIISLSKIPDLLQNFKSQRLDLIVMGSGEANSILKTYRDLKSVTIQGGEAVFAIALPKGSSLLKPINQILEKWINDGTLKKWQDRWMIY